MYYFTADEHYGHTRIIEYCHRPYDSVEEMDEEIIRRHNLVVTGKDTVVHVGDFSWGKEVPEHIMLRLNGHHIYIKGSHDKWMHTKDATIWEKNIEGCYVAACHYPMITWPRCHYASLHVFGHAHGNMFTKSDGMTHKGLLISTYVAESLAYDVGVDCNDFYPVGFDVLKRLMVEKAEAILESQTGSLLPCYEEALRKLIGGQE